LGIGTGIRPPHPMKSAAVFLDLLVIFVLPRASPINNSFPVHAILTLLS
jgi:hypothetical protein